VRTGRIGDGKILVMPMEKVSRIRPADFQPDAITVAPARG
jgi:nitrogen regulatory protein PII